MKKIVLGIVALLFAIVLTSCGSAEPAATETSATPAGGAAPAAGTPAATPAPPEEVELEVPRQFKVDPQKTPQFFQDALKAKEPLLVLFYSDDSISQEVMSVVNSVYTSDKYSGVVKFLLLKIEDQDEDAAASPETDGKGEIIELARAFSVGYVPLTAVLTRDGTVIFEEKGYIDIKVLEQALYGAINK